MLTITQRQSNLKFLGYYNGIVDGIELNLTKNAYILFQKDYNLTVDGIYGFVTDDKLTSIIKEIQSKLGTTPDGVVGPNTILKCKEYQLYHDLTPDGICGTKTIKKLYSSNLSWDNIMHFKKSEMNCPCCGMNNTDLNLMLILEKIREHFGNKPIIITSGCRCKKHNASLTGSASNSKHLYGKAVDFYIKGVSTSDTLNYCKSLVNNSTLRYTYTNNTNMSGVVHIDIN